MTKLSVLLGQRLLATVWLVFGTIVLVLMTLLTNNGLGAPYREEIQQWTTACVVPTLTIILGTLAVLELQSDAKRLAREREVSGFFLAVTLAASVLYFALVLSALLGGDTSEQKLASVRAWAQVVMIYQGLLGVCLGVFFGKEYQSSA